MSWLCTLVFGVLFTGSQTKQIDTSVFPPWFKFGASTAAYQVEGAWNVSDKAESIWDRLVHSQPGAVADGSNGDVACDSYHLWRRDIEMAEELGLDMYRFSISWPRLLPTGFPNYISEDGQNYYNNLIDGLLEKGIEPFVTMYHWDLPQNLQDLGGWANPLISTWFADYARVLFSLFGDRVKLWVTINEPISICDGGYLKFMAPYLVDKLGVNLCNKNILIAHAKAYRIYDEEFRYKCGGKISISNLFFWFMPETPEDEEVTDLMIQYWEGRYGHPIYSKDGGWPPQLEEFLAVKSKREGNFVLRLPPFTEEEIDLIRGTYDFYALNHYSSRLVRRVSPGEEGSYPFYGSDMIGVSFVNDPAWEVGEIDFFTLYPEGLRAQLHWIRETYGVNDIVITENGVPSIMTDLNDWQRMRYLKKILEQILLALHDGVNVMGYVAWSLMDNFEWLGGYTSNFGLYAVDFKHENRTRTPRQSARYYSRVTRTRSTDLIRNGQNYIFE